MLIHQRKEVKSLSEQSIFNSSLHDEHTFYDFFLNDLTNATREIIIESPFITVERADIFIPIFQTVLERNIKIFILTRDPKEHSNYLEKQSEQIIAFFEEIGIQVLLCTGNHHRKLAIIDREILWEGSLNILSQGFSREIMRRIKSKKYAQELFDFISYSQFL